MNKRILFRNIVFYCLSLIPYIALWYFLLGLIGYASWEGILSIITECFWRDCFKQSYCIWICSGCLGYIPAVYFRKEQMVVIAGYRVYFDDYFCSWIIRDYYFGRSKI